MRRSCTIIGFAASICKVQKVVNVFLGLATGC
jgi:hypothetical protein